MRRISAIFGGLVLCLGSATAQVSLDQASVTNAASYIPAGLPNSGVAQGGIFIVKGKNLGACGTVVANAFPIPANMGGTSMKVTVNGTAKDVPMIYVVGCIGGGQNGQLAGIVPSDTPVGAGQLSVTYNGTSATAPIQVVKNALGLFTLNQAGTGPVAALNADYSYHTKVNSLKPGDTVQLFATGLGPITGADNATPPVGNLPNANVQVFIGGKAANFSYAGRAPGISGLDQINVPVPQGVDGCQVPVAVVVNNVVSNYATLAVAANGGACSDPVGFSSNDLSTAQKNGNFKLGEIDLSRISIALNIPGLPSIPGIPTSFTTDSGSSSFLKFDLTMLQASSGQVGYSTIGSCLVFTGTDTTSKPVDPVLPVGLDAGASIKVLGPKGAKDLTGTQGQKGYYSATLSGSNPLSPTPYLDPGTYTLSGTGGADVGPFSVNVTLPTALNWTNQDSITTVNRSQGVTVTWTGGDPNNFVSIFGSSSNATAKVSATFYCTERNSAGRFTVPSAVLLALPPTSGGAATDIGGLLMVGSSGQYGTFNATGIDRGVVSSTSLTGKTVTFQ